jgi:hypothetical protein
MMLTDTLDGDDGVIEDGDLGGERPNDQRVPVVLGKASLKAAGSGGSAVCVAR